MRVIEVISSVDLKLLCLLLHVALKSKCSFYFWYIVCRSPQFKEQNILKYTKCNNEICYNI